jgi:hypothetical protein
METETHSRLSSLSSVRVNRLEFLRVDEKLSTLERCLKRDRRVRGVASKRKAEQEGDRGDRNNGEREKEGREAHLVDATSEEFRQRAFTCVRGVASVTLQCI